MLLPAAVFLWIALFVSDYRNVWVQPEVNGWRVRLLPMPCTPQAIVTSAFNWPLMEFQPRLTRPLGNLLDVVDTCLRRQLWKVVTPYPVVSIVHLLTFVLAPILLYRVLRSLGVDEAPALGGVALYLSNPATLSLLAMNFRPGKSAACASMVIVLWWASRLRGRSFRHVLPLFLFMFCAFFLDEIAVLLYPALLLLYPEVAFASRKSLAAVVALPLGYGIAAKRLMPWLHAVAGFPAVDAGYDPMRKLFDVLSVFAEGRLYYDLWRQFGVNSRIALLESLGIADPRLPGSAVYLVICASIVLSLGALVFFAGRRLWLSRGAKVAGQGRPAALRSAALLLVFLMFHTLLLGLVANEVWGLYWYGAFIGIGSAIATATLIQAVRPPRLLTLSLVASICAGTLYVFPATNNAYKLFHYYPYRPLLLTDVFRNRINRFHLPRQPVESPDFLSLTRAMGQTDAAVRGVPLELSYIPVERGWIGRYCLGSYYRFDLVKTADVMVTCSDARDNVGPIFAGEWSAPQRVTIDSGVLVINERGETSLGLVSGRHMEAFDWGVTAELSPEGTSIAWSNGTFWVRPAAEATAYPDGKWECSGTCLVRGASSAFHVVIHDPGREDSAVAFVYPQGVIFVPEWHIDGVLDANGQSLRWSNGETWTRMDVEARTGWGRRAEGASWTGHHSGRYQPPPPPPPEDPPLELPELPPPELLPPPDSWEPGAATPAAMLAAAAAHIPVAPAPPDSPPPPLQPVAARPPVEQV